MHGRLAVRERHRSIIISDASLRGYDARQISVTREMLEPIISRPKLSDKLLNMPPFRFLHDIVSEVTRQVCTRPPYTVLVSVPVL